MKTKKNLTLVSSLSLLALSVCPSSALVIMLSDLVPAGTGVLENFFNNNFTNVTEIRHGNYANYANSQDALNGTGAFAGSGPADIFVIGRSLGSGDYSNGATDGYNGIAIPFINFTSYTARQDGNRLGWHASGATNGTSVLGSETTITSAGASMFGLAEGAYNLISAVSDADSAFNGLAGGNTTEYGGGKVLATVGSDTLAAYWETGAAPGSPTDAGVATFAGPRLLFNLDNDPNAGNDGANDLANLTADGFGALRSSIAFATPLSAIPEPSTSLLGLAALGVFGLRRRR